MLHICREYHQISQKLEKDMTDRCDDMVMQGFRNARDCNCDPRELAYRFPSSDSEFDASYVQSICYLGGKNVIF